MKYFEIEQPYYALIKANSKEQAEEKYDEIVCGIGEGCPNCIEEVSKAYALSEFLSAPECGDNKHSLDMAMNKFNRCNADVLVMDPMLG